MPKLNSLRVKHRLAELDWSTEDLSQRTDIPFGSLRNAVAGRDPLNLRRIYRVAQALELDAAEILAAGTSTEPHQPTQPKSPPKRQDKEQTKKAPKRVHGRAVA